jgi:hypothetical protein
MVTDRQSIATLYPDLEVPDHVSPQWQVLHALDVLFLVKR